MILLVEVNMVSHQEVVHNKNSKLMNCLVSTETQSTF